MTLPFDDHRARPFFRRHPWLNWGLVSAVVANGVAWVLIARLLHLA